MDIRKIFAFLIVTSISASLFAAPAKKSSSKKESEKSVESEYLSDIDTEIIVSLANSDQYDNKLVALQYLKSAVEEGNLSDGVIQALDKLAGEGTTNASYTRGRLMNNFPDIRREACLIMGNVKTEHSKNTLVSIAIADSEPMVVAAAVRALGSIGINDNDEVVEAIAYANRRNEVLNPTSSLALEVLNTFETLFDSTENKRIIIDSVSRIAIDYNYVSPVRQKASKMLKKMTSYAKEEKEAADQSSDNPANEEAEVEANETDSVETAETADEVVDDTGSGEM